MIYEIKHRWSSQILFSLDCESLKDALLEAIKSRADLSGANLSRAHLSRADLSGANLSGAYLSGAHLSGADLSGAHLSGADLSGAYLSGADLSGANLSRADLSGANLSRAYLSGAYLSGAYLSGADLSRAYLSGAHLSGADLSGAYLSGAYLSGAYLSRAHLSGADLSGADLSGANLSGAYGINKHLVTPLLVLRDQPGPIRLYKLVTASGVGPFNGGITYEIGKEYEVADASTEETIHCAAGINVATLDWCMKEWKQGYRILIAEFSVADIAAIPTATDGKIRLFRCSIIGEKDLSEIGLVNTKAAHELAAVAELEAARS